MKKIVIYPGRFQPMLPHHANVFQHLQSQFPGADVYIATSDKVEGTKSAFNFNEKATIMSKMHGIPAEKIIQAKVPYLIDSYKTQFDQENNMVIFAVGGKDADRFPMGNIDDSTGLDMTVRGEPRPKYYQMINTLEQHPPLPMSERGYVYNSPTFSNDGEVASASAFRNAFISAPDEGSRTEIFTKYMGGYNNNIYALFVNKLLDNKMKTENAYNLDVIKYLSGLLNEAPINFDDFSDESDPDSDNLKPGFKQDNMINQLGKIIDSDDAGKDVDAMKVKKFSPKTTVQTDDDDTVEIAPAEAKALKGMMDMLTSARMGEEESAREKFLRSIQTTVGLESMLDFAKSKGLVKEETKILPQVDLSDIKDDYQVPETTDEAVAPGEYTYTLEYNGESSGYAVHKLTITSPEGETKEVANDFTYFDDDEGEIQDQLASWFNYGHGIGDSPDGYQNDPSTQEGLEKESFDPMNEPTAYDAAMEVYDNGDERALAEYLGMSDMEFDQELNEYGAMHGLHADDDREEIISGMVEELISNADDKYSHQYEDKSVQEGALKDVIIDAQQMDKEEFDNVYGGSFDYDEILAQFPSEDGDLEEGKLPAGLQAYQDKKNGKKDDKADKDDKDDKEVDEDKDEVDEEATFVPGFIGADGKATSKPTKKDFDSNKEYQSMKKKLGKRIPGPTVKEAELAQLKKLSGI